MFPVIEVDIDTAEMYEQLGTKAKFWYRDPQMGRCLFKRGRKNTGENWAEKFACELAAVLGVPHAYYELARCGDDLGVSTPNFVPRRGRLVHGNEVLAVTKEYKQARDARFYQSRAHTITLVLSMLMAAVGSDDWPLQPPDGFLAFPGVTTAADVFVGYLMLDAWIGNQDRHDQNWGVVVELHGLGGEPQMILRLAPSFDHGSSLARNETDESCREMLETRDRGRHISAYVGRARSALYPHGATGKPKALFTLDAFAFARRQLPSAGDAWLRRLESITHERINEMVHMLPDEFVSEIRREFVVEYLKLNRQRLLALREAS
jgi:hypothetical protein